MQVMADIFSDTDVVLILLAIFGGIFLVIFPLALLGLNLLYRLAKWLERAPQKTVDEGRAPSRPQ